MSERVGEEPSPGKGSPIGRVMAWGLLFLVVFAPLAFGGVEPWARGAILIVAGLMGAAWLIDSGARARLPLTANRLLAIPALLVVLLVMLQQVPLPRQVVRLLSPTAAGLYERTVPGWSEGATTDPQQLPAWTLRQAAGRMPAAAAAVAPPADVPIPPEMSATEGTLRTLSLEPFATRDDLILILCCFVVFIAAARMGHDEPSMTRLARCAVLSAGAVSAIGIAQMLTWNGRLYWVREGTYKNIFGPFVNRNSYAALAGLVLPVALALAVSELRRWKSGSRERAAAGMLWGTCALVIGAGIAASGSRGGALTSMAGVIALVIFITPSLSARRGLLLLVGLGGLIAVAGLAWGGAFGGEPDGRLAHRIDVWQRSLALFGDYPLLGSGLGTFRYAFLKYAPPERGWWTTAHNEYLELLCDLGLIGAALVLVAFIGWTRNIVRRAGSFGEEMRPLRAAMLAGLAALLLHAAANADLRVPAIALIAVAFAGAVGGEWTGSLRSTAPRSGARRKALLVAAALLVVFSFMAGVSRIAAFRARYLAAEALALAELDEAWDHLADAAWWQPGDPATWRQMSTVARNATGFGVAFRGIDGFRQRDRLGVGLGATARALLLNPAHSSVWMDLASLYEAFGLARVKYERMLAGDDRTEVPATGLLPEDLVAIAAATTAIDLQPEMFLHHDFLARLYWKRGLTGDAADEMRRSFALMPRPSAHDALAEQGLAERLADAILEGIDAARVGPFITEVSRLRGRAEVLERLERFPEASAAWIAAKEAGSDDDAIEYEVRIARIEQAQGLYDQSLDRLRLVVHQAGDARWSAEALYFIGKALSQKGEHRGALASFAQYLEKRPDVAAAWQSVGKELEALGNARAAETTYRAGMERLPEDSGIAQLLVGLLTRQGRTDEAARVAARRGGSRSSREMEEILRQLRQGGARSRP